MTFDEARTFRLNFGKYNGETLDEIASTDQGLRYLDWMVGALDLYGDVKDAIEAYLEEPTIQSELERIL